LLSRVLDVLEPVPFDCSELNGLWPNGEAPSSFRIGPTRSATDGYFAASFLKR
jgi:hypothetical protein